MSRGSSTRPPAGGRGSILDLDPYDDAFWQPDPNVVPLSRKRSPGAGRSTGRAKDAAPAPARTRARKDAAPTRARGRKDPAPSRRAGSPRLPASTRAAGRPAARRSAPPPRRRPPARPAGSVWKAGKPRRRLVALAVVASLLFAVMLGRVALLQTVDRPGLQEAGVDQRTNVVALPADRGVVFDRNGTELALSVPKKTVWADPMVVAKAGKAAEVAASLAGVLALTPDQVAKVQEQLSDPASRFAYLSRFVTDEVATAVEDLGLPGVYVMNESERVYPAGNVGRAVIGSTDAFGVGIAGLEKQYDTLLTGDAGEVVYEQDQGGNTIPTGRRDMKPPVPGDDLVLTIDKDLQYMVEQLLVQQVAATNARGGMVVILDSASGEVLAMANVRRNADTGAVEVTDANLAVIDSYEPGSVAKLITASAALQEGVIDTERHMQVPGAIRMYDFDFTDAWPHGTEWWGIRDIVRLSSNIGTIFLAKDLGAERMEQYLHGFGIGVPSGLEFPGETPGILKPVDEWQGSEKVTVSYGQGVGTTSLQLAAAVNVIANGGKYVAPSLVKATVDGSGKLVPAAPADQREVISPQTAATMTEILRSVVCAGTAKEAKVPGYAVAGKTGTAYKAQGNGYEGANGRKYVASFAGFLPAEAPRLSINVSIDEPIGDHYGGLVAAPLFSQVALQALRLLEVPPSPDGGACPASSPPAEP